MKEEKQDYLKSIDKLGVTFIFILLYIGTLNAIGGNSVGTLSIGAVIVLSVILFTLKTIYYKKIYKFHIYIIIIAILYALTSLISVQFSSYGPSITNTLQFLACLGVFLYFTTLKLDKSIINRAYIITILFVLFHFFLWIIKGMPSQFASIYPNSNLIGAYMFISLFFIFIKIGTSNHKLLHIGIALIALIVLFASDTRSIILSLAITVSIIIIWPFLRKNRTISIMFYGLFIVSLFIVIFIYPNLPNWKYYYIFETWMLEHTGKSIMSGRSDIWLAVNEYISINPGFGYGPNVVASDLIGRDASTHNLFLNITLQIGYVGLVLILILLFIIFMNYLKPKNNIIVKVSGAFFFGILTHQLFEITLIQNQLSIGLFQWIIIAAGISERFDFTLNYDKE